MTISNITNLSTFTNDLKAYQSTRKAVSNRMYTILNWLVILLTCCSIAIAGSYAWGLGEGIPQSIILTLTAVGIEIALVFFSSVMYPRFVMSVFGLLAGVGVLLVSILTITSFLISQQHEQEQTLLRSKNNYRDTLLSDRNKLDISNYKDRGTIAILNNRIETIDKEIATIKKTSPETKSTAIYHYISKSIKQPVETVSLLFRGLYGLIVVCTAVALAGYLETIYSSNSLKHWINSYNNEAETIQSGQLRHLELNQLEAPEQIKQIESDNPNNRYRRSNRDGVVPSYIYLKVKNEVDKIESGEPVPVRKIKETAKKTDYAYGAIDKLLGDGVIKQNEAGRYIKA